MGPAPDNAHVAVAAKGGAVAFAGRLFVWAMRLVLAVVLARLLGADQYGLYNIALTVATLGSAFSVIGLDSALVRYVAVYQRRGDRAGVLGTLKLGLGLPIAVGVVAAGVLISIAGPVARDVLGDVRLEPLLRVVALLIPAMVANTVLAATLQGAQRIGWAVLAEQFAQPLVRLALLVVFALIGLTPELAVLASTLAAVVVTLLLVLFVQRDISLVGIHSRGRPEPRSLLAFSLPVYFSNIVTTIGSSLQVVLLGAMASVASAGVFAVANQIMLIGTIFHNAIVHASMAVLAELHDAGDRLRLWHLYRTTSKWTFTLNLPFFLLAVIFPDVLLSIFGSDFTNAAPALAVLAFATAVNTATGTSGAMLDMTGHTRVKFINSTVSVVLAILLNLLLIPPLGVIGAAVAAFGSISCVNLLRVLQVFWLVGATPYDRSWLKPVLAGIAALLAAVAVSRVLGNIGAVPGIVVLMTTYVALLFGLGISDDDRWLLSRAADRLWRRRSSRGAMGRPGATEAAKGSTT